MTIKSLCNIAKVWLYEYLFNIKLVKLIINIVNTTRVPIFFTQGTIPRHPLQSMQQKIHQIEIKYIRNLFDQVEIEGILQSVTQTVALVPARQCVSVCVCVYVRMSPSFAKACGVALLDAGSGAALLCAALCSAVCCRCCCWLAGVFCVSVFCLPAAAAVATACRLPPAAC